MQIIEVNPKTISKLIQKTVKEWRLENKDAYLKFTDGSTARIHVLNPNWETYVNLETTKSSDYPLFVDTTDNHMYFPPNGDKESFTTRTMSIYFDRVRYYINDKLTNMTRAYTPIIEIHYYEEGEPVGDHNSRHLRAEDPHPQATEELH